MKPIHCHRCDHKWYRRQPGKPKKCPKCFSKYWATPKGTLTMGRPLKNPVKMVEARRKKAGKA